MASQSVASMNQLGATLRSDGPGKAHRGTDHGGVLGHVKVAASRRLQQIREHNHHRRGSRGGRGLHRHVPHRSEKEIAEMRIQGAPEEFAEQILQQAQEQMEVLQHVQSRVQSALSNSKDLLVETKVDRLDPQVTGRQWIETSKRVVNGAMFRYSESCEEREEQLNEFCDWFELYENIWPLPLVSNEVQFEGFMGKDLEVSLGDVSEEDASQNLKMHEMWPKMVQMRDDLSQIMKLTSTMGQKALGGDARDENLKLRNLIQDQSEQIRDLEDDGTKLRATVQELRDDLVRQKSKHDSSMQQHAQELASVKRDAELRVLQLEEHNRQEKERNQLEMARLQNKMQDTADAHAAEAAGLRERIAALEHKVESLETLRDEMLADVAAKEKFIGGLSQRNDRLNQELDIIKVQMEQVTGELRAERESPYVKRLELETTALNEQVLGLRESLEAAEETIANKEETIQNQLTLIVDLKRKIEVIEAQTKKYREDMHKMEQSLAKAHSEAKQLNVELEKQKAKMEEREAQFATLSADKEKLEQQIASERARFELSLQAERDRTARLEEERAAEQKTLRDMQSAIKSERSRWAAERKAHEDALHAEKETARLKEREAAAARADLDAAHSETAAARAAFEAEEARVQAEHEAAVAARVVDYEARLSAALEAKAALEAYKAVHDAKRFADAQAEAGHDLQRAHHHHHHHHHESRGSLHSLAEVLRVLRGRLSALRTDFAGEVGGSPPPPPSRTKWTRRVPHPVLIGHAAPLTPY